MIPEKDKKAMKLGEVDRDTLRRMFTRKIPISQKVIRLDDEDETRKFLNDFRAYEEKQKKVAVATYGFNPDIHVVVTKEQLDIAEQVKTMVGQVNTINDYVETVKTINAKQKSVTKAALTKEEKSIRRTSGWLQPKRRF